MSKKHLSWKGWVLLIALVCILLLLWVLLVMDWQTHRSGSYRQITCMNQLKLVGVAIEMYSSAWDNRFLPLYTTDQRAPDGKAWPDLLMPYVKAIDPSLDDANRARLYRCPDSARDRLNYSLNRRIASLGNDRIKYPSSTIVAFESVSDSPGNNNLNGDAVSHPTRDHLPATGTLVDWPSSSKWHYWRWPEWSRIRHVSRRSPGDSNVLFADGHVTGVRLRDLPGGDAASFDPTKPGRL